ncbi:hypothetical protein [Sinimarinibacterium thermocellulolyticum]|uniref:Uncharacterized protein n=1 Tax=Sinimarinibacterium thermocellulolyticum TaxID=3170016 RepID=A0ABV2A6T1_9GAMM
MFRIRKIHDAVSPANRDALEQVRAIIRAQFPRPREEDLDKVEQQLRDPLRYRYRSILFVAENVRGQVRRADADNSVALLVNRGRKRRSPAWAGLRKPRRALSARSRRGGSARRPARRDR